MKEYFQSTQLQDFKFLYNMKNKIIIIILIGIVILLAGLYFYFTLKPTVNNTNQITPTQQPNLPTTPLLPTKVILRNDLDIVSVPIDGSTNVTLDTTLRITFSKQFTLNDIKFNISPNTPHLEAIENNILVITPQTQWNKGTPYTFSIIFPDDEERVRTYTFKTQGSPQQFLPDTRPEGYYEQSEQLHREEYPDIYVTNKTPYENGVFSVRSEFDPTPPGHFYFIISSKGESSSVVKQAVGIWLESINITQTQINSLDIRYK